ncbi:hypothetical protein [Rhodobacter calidifons]|uniref:Uncharacterized protein n=1 Tax=Rhodobacter calidifons TaxID=2715277 RepID=A0ABX0G4P7_9RHOB|nr:hypothetical protein [Rhodobacter calidifons]NHB75868.1 hypothetical protein [Rhodobacter calidifons]
MSKIDLMFLAVYGAIVSFLVGFVLQGPIFGLREYSVTLLIAIGSWYAGTSLIARLSGTEVRLDESFQRMMWRWTLLSAMVLILICVVYSLTVLAGRSTYAGPWLLLHFAVIFVSGTLARSMAFAASRAVKSRGLAIERAKKAAITREKRSTERSTKSEP